MFILIMGLPGTGKSTFARALAESTGATHLNSDQIRKVIGRCGAYAPSDKKAVYDELFRRVEDCLQQGQDVIVDSTFYKKNIRKPYFQLAIKYGVALNLIVINASEPTLKERLQKPRPDSEADFNVYKKIKAEYEPPENPCLELWSDEMTIEQMLMRATFALGI